jgi:uncharacterized protein (TIGR03437 family)
MIRTRVALLLLFLAVAFNGFSQTSNTVFSAGYAYPVPIKAAPGQILNLFVQGVGSSLSQRIAASGFPLPTTLAGISVEMTQIIGTSPVAVALLAVFPVNTCVNGASLGGAACGRYAVVTVQVPFELTPQCLLCAAPVSNVAQFVVSENGIAGGAIEVTPTADQVHVANLCDIDTTASVACAPVPLITHADGSLVTATSPAKLGEEVVIYALGLGPTNPAVPTGQVTPSAAPTQERFEVNYAFEPNAAPSKGLIGTSVPTVCSTTAICLNDPAFSGLTPGFASLYQVNFVIPAVSPQGMLPCGPSGITSNLTLTIVGSTSFDGAGICVAPPSGSTSSSLSNAAAVPPSSATTIPLGPFAPNTTWFPIGSDVTYLGQPVRPGSYGVPGPVSAKQN